MSELAITYAAPFLVAAAGLTTIAVNQLVARLAIAGCWLPDKPNGRSSHQRVTPRSGGVGVVLAWIAGVCVAAFAAADGAFDILPLGLAPLVGAVFLLGLVDDAFGLRALWKLVGQFAAAIAFIAVFGPLHAAPLPFSGDASLGAFAAPITVFWIVGFMNAFNFMDGVNGVAAACGAFVLCALAVMAGYFGAPVWGLAAGLGAAALISFLPFNLPHGRLFLGDNGSQAVGFLIAVTAVGAANASDGAANALFIPVAMTPFIFDVTFTLVHRALRGRDIFSAHREHLYQIFLRMGASHAGVTAIYLALTALSTAVAILMLRLPPDAQWAAPLALIAVFATPAALFYQRAERAGLLATEEERRAETPGQTRFRDGETIREPLSPVSASRAAAE